MSDCSYPEYVEPGNMNLDVHYQQNMFSTDPPICKVLDCINIFNKKQTYYVRQQLHIGSQKTMKTQ